jgi:endonuclease/exonuclease/phosphatase family metal-dependent hydrolase
MVDRTAHPDKDPRCLVVVTLNLWGNEPPLTQRLDLAVEQLAQLQPDVVCLQEVRPLDGNSGSTTADHLALALGMTATYACHSQWLATAHRNAGQEGLAVITALPVMHAEHLVLPKQRMDEGRILQCLQLQATHGPIWVHNTHLNYRLDDGQSRAAQVAAIDAVIRTRRDNDSPPQILCGDFNATADADEIRYLRGLTSIENVRTHFQDAWLRLHREPNVGDGPAQGITWSSENELTRPLRSLDIDRRIDYIFVTSRKRDGRGTIHRCEVVMTKANDNGVHVSDHYGVLAEIQIAPGQ